MSTRGIIEMQIGKNGLVDGTFEWLENAFKYRDNVKIRVLKSAGHNSESVKKIAEDIVNRLGKNYTCKIVGFVISIKKWRRAKRLD